MLGISHSSLRRAPTCFLHRPPNFDAVAICKAELFAFRRIRSLQLAPDRFWKGHSFDRLVCRWYGTRAKIVATCGIRACQGPEPARSIVGVVFILPLEQLQNKTGKQEEGVCSVVPPPNQSKGA